MKAIRIEFVLVILGILLEIAMAFMGVADVIEASLGGIFLLLAIAAGLWGRLKKQRHKKEALHRDNEIFL